MLLLYFYIAMLQKEEDNWATNTELFSVLSWGIYKRKPFKEVVNDCNG